MRISHYIFKMDFMMRIKAFVRDGETSSQSMSSGKTQTKFIPLSVIPNQEPEACLIFVFSLLGKAVLKALQDGNMGNMGDGGQYKKSVTPSLFEGRDGDHNDENKEIMQNNGLMQNGLDDETMFRRSSHQNSPIDDGKMNQMVSPNKGDNDFFDNQNQFQQPGFQLDSPPFEPKGLEPGHFEYNNQMMPSTDSPNFNMDYAQALQDGNMGNMGDGGQYKKSVTPSLFEGRDGNHNDENKEIMQNNGLMQNGLDDETMFRRSSHQNSPIDDGKMNQMVSPNKGDNDFFDNQNQFQQPGFQLDSPPFEPKGLEPGHFEYNNQMMPSTDSPNFNMDYAQALQDGNMGNMGDGGQYKKSVTPSLFEGRDGDHNDDNKESMQKNGLMQNGLDDENVFRRSSHQNSPIDDGMMNQMVSPNKGDNVFFDNQNQFQQPGFQLDSPFEPKGLEPGHFEYNNQMVPSTDSPNFNMDYAQMENSNMDHFDLNRTLSITSMDHATLIHVLKVRLSKHKEEIEQIKHDNRVRLQKMVDLGKRMDEDSNEFKKRQQKRKRVRFRQRAYGSHSKELRVQRSTHTPKTSYTENITSHKATYVRTLPT